jgi:hypothetical protein
MASGIFTQRQVQREIIKGSWSNLKTPAVEYLVVAGGGSGGNSIGGGGGAGGLLQGHIPVISGTPITVTVGAGGSASQGGNTAFASIIATGGGKGGAYLDEIGGPGGSGGGGGARETPALNANGGVGISGQGNAGGVGFPLSTNYTGAGGGGAGTIGRTAVNNYAGNGGDGLASEISGNRTVYAGGGGGATHPTGTAGVGGSGGGGAGTASGGGAGVAGTTNLGAGGGGGTYPNAGGGAGGSGVVIISYPDTYANAASQTNGTFSTSGSGSIYFPGSTVAYTPSSSTYNLGSNNFTMEMWVNVSNSNNLIRGISQYGGFAFLLSGNTLQYYLTSDGASWNVASAVSGGTVPFNTWTHVALVRNGNVFTPYVNGVAGTTTTSSATLTNNDGFCLFGEQPLVYPGGNGTTTGYASNFRVVIGTAVYTSNFTPSSIPLTEITNTKVLMSTVSGSYLADSSSVSGITLVGTNIPTWNQASPFPTGLGYKKRVYTWTTSGTITF